MRNTPTGNNLETCRKTAPAMAVKATKSGRKGRERSGGSKHCWGWWGVDIEELKVLHGLRDPPKGVRGCNHILGTQS